MIKVDTFVVSSFSTNSYLITDTTSGDMAVVDPGGYSNELTMAITASEKTNLKYILLTHGHFDHVGFVKELKEKTGAKVVIGKNEVELLNNPKTNLSIIEPLRGFEKFSVDLALKDNESIPFASSIITFIETPGHTVGSGCYIFGDYFFTGDTLMKGTIGRVDLPTGNYRVMLESISKIKNLNKNYRVCPGHGDLTSVDYEKNTNPYLGESVNDFIY